MITYFAVEKNGTEICSNVEPEWDSQDQTWWCLDKMEDGNYYNVSVTLPPGSIEKVTGKKLTWKDKPLKTDNIKQKSINILQKAQEYSFNIPSEIYNNLTKNVNNIIWMDIKMERGLYYELDRKN